MLYDLGVTFTFSHPIIKPAHYRLHSSENPFATSQAPRSKSGAMTKAPKTKFIQDIFLKIYFNLLTILPKKEWLDKSCVTIPRHSLKILSGQHIKQYKIVKKAVQNLLA